MKQYTVSTASSKMRSALAVIRLHAMMKYSICILLIWFLISCHNENIDNPNKRNEKWGWWVDAKTNKGRWRELKNDGILNKWETGHYTLFYSNGKIRQQGAISNGLHVDTATVYDTLGTLQGYLYKEKDTINLFFLKDGRAKVYYANGNLFFEGIVKNHLMSDTLTTYYHNGNIKSIQTTNRGTGWIVSFYENGHIKDSSYQLKDSVTLLVKQWNEQGQLIESYGFDKQNWNGIAKRFYPSGNVKDSFFFYKGKQHGLSKSWYESGKVRTIDNYKYGVPIGTSTFFFENGKIKAEMVFENGLTVRRVMYDEMGKVIMEQDH